MAEVESYPEAEDTGDVMETSVPAPDPDQEQTNNNNLGEEPPKPVEVEPPRPEEVESPKPVEAEPRVVMDQVIHDVEVTGRTSLHAVDQGFPFSEGIDVPEETPNRLQLVLDLLGAAGEKVAGDQGVNGKFVLIRASTSYIYLAV